ncbi:hypothetical protein T265_03779 [Opisthorchis viverrini]|uniref:Uncharacterized protein n=1 Tax=Opisthorchis viverrini TaxID=6198 RepID=A0A075AHD2_OPIVI|nr:hypothetical protein T265_03779 [Opisthorchis viverrini]KER29679.1 hypothetical protein T265_03779 [Opisthorchis viverrini]
MASPHLGSYIPRFHMEKKSVLDTTENQRCGPHPIDLYLTELLTQMEQNGSNSLSDKLAYDQILVAFTAMHDYHPVYYLRMLRAIRDWNRCRASSGLQ